MTVLDPPFEIRPRIDSTRKKDGIIDLKILHQDIAQWIYEHRDSCEIVLLLGDDIIKVYPIDASGIIKIPESALFVFYDICISVKNSEAAMMFKLRFHGLYN